ncbi:RNA polymerase sigma factor [Dyella sp.]|jgi:RNA polymerase sigma factor (sigma-70 family)|uniref:RNA polymerase sigma factor n=1 Tax=Dyella sp. TaxID=1869338 RepID=UPI002D7A1F27|nr:sigma-70 family RNA polymerase sigma factor [Dyella sp.]HET6432261.1 sigma-70 family RNA polymerase sigma factor [Dyella sp.]
MDQAELHRRIDAVWRLESPRVIGTLMRVVRDLDLAEELAQDALVAALERWPTSGIPDNPGAWLTTTARHRAIDQLRHRQLAERKHALLGGDPEHEPHVMPDLDALDDDIGDDLLRLIFIACHPVLPREAQIALTLRLLGGLTTAEIARAFLQSEATVAQRIVRAKRTLAERQLAYEVPRGDERRARLDGVLGVIYLIFNEGYAASTGDHWMRPALCEEALRLARTLAAHLADEPEVHGLLALLEIQASRSAARIEPDGTPILLAQQNRARWDHLAIQRGLTALSRAEKLGGSEGPYALQAAIAACHARARDASATDWPRIAALYDRLAEAMPSPVVELNRAVAVAMAEGPAAALPLVETLRGMSALAHYHLLPAVHGDLLEKLGRRPEAREAFLQAAALTGNAREQALLRQRAQACADG